MAERPDPRLDEDSTGTTPAGGMQHGSSSGEGGSVGRPAPDEDQGPGHHPRPDTPESKVEHQADQPGVTTEEAVEEAGR